MIYYNGEWIPVKETKKDVFTYNLYADMLDTLTSTESIKEYKWQFSSFYQEIYNFSLFTLDIKMGRIMQQIRLFNLPFPRVTELSPAL